MKIAIIGTGRIGSTLGKAWMATGHDVIFGARNPTKVREFSDKTRPIAEAIQYGEIILLAIPGSAVIETVQNLDLSGKLIIDATNGGASEQPVVQSLAKMFPDAAVFKAFNTLGFEIFQNPLVADEQAEMFFIGSETKQSTVATLVQDVGLKPIYVGGLEQAATIDAALSFWFTLSKRFGRRVAYRILHDGA